MIVYVETNFVLEIACEQQQVVSANEILNENGRPSGFDIYSAFRSYIFTSSSQPSPCALHMLGLRQIQRQNAIGVAGLGAFWIDRGREV